MVPEKQDDSENAHEHGRRQTEYDADRIAGCRERDQWNYRLRLFVMHSMARTGDRPLCPAGVDARFEMVRLRRSDIFHPAILC